MIWATVSSQSCFCWLYRASPSLAAKMVISLISVLTIWWCPCVESSLVLLKRVFAMTSAFSWQNSISLCLASFRTPRPNLPVTPGVSWLPTFAFQSPIMKRTSFFVQACFRKGRGTRDQIANICWVIKKQESSKKTSISALLTMPKPLAVWITINCGKFLKRWEYQTIWPVFWETCMQVRKQQLELDMYEQTGSK